MPISGSTLAYKQARAGIMRAGASRGNFYTPNVFITIDGVNATSSVMIGSLVIQQALNDEPDTAQFRLGPAATIPVTPGKIVTVGSGCATNYEFAGQIVRVSRTYEKARGAPLVFVDVECIDYGRLLDRRLVTAVYKNMSATDIAIDILTRNTIGFTWKAVAAGLPTIEDFPVTNETVQGTLKRLANLVDGGFYVDNYRDVHLFGASGDAAPNAGTNPLSVSDNSTNVRSFSYLSDISQQRTRVIVEGKRTTCPIGSPGPTTSAAAGTIDYLVVAGGGFGGGGGGVNGGGGGGGVKEGSAVVTLNTYTVVVGAGAASANTNGSDSSIRDAATFDVTAHGGGHGSGDSGAGTSGGCGGGGCGNRPNLQAGGAGVSGEGYAGGTGGYWFSTGPELFFSDGGGGGGAGGVGGNGQVNLNDSGVPGSGGAGRLSSISGTPAYYGGGGAGSSGAGTSSGGVGGGGNAGVAGTANTGGGGGAGAAGGSGIVIIRYRTGDFSATGGVMTTSGVWTIHTFTSTATFTVSTVLVTLPPAAIADFPLADGTQINNAAGTVRVGNYVVSYSSVKGPTLSEGQNPPSTYLTANANIGDASLFVNAGSSTFTQSSGWVKVGEQYVRYTSVSATEIAIPASGYGSLGGKVTGAAGDGTTVTWVNSLVISSTIFDPPFDAGSEVVQRIALNDDNTQAALVVIEGTDGVHEQVISDDRLSVTGAQGRAESDISAFSNTTGIIEAEWDTNDLNARPGRRQAVSFQGFVGTLLITRVEITFPLKSHKPFRRCQASTLKQPGLYDVVLTQVK